MVQRDLDNLMRQYKVQPVGKGYIDCIVSLEDVFTFISGLSDIRIDGLTWWCHCKDQNSGCPHGMGGLPSEYYDGWFSELCLPLTEFESNEQATAYLETLDASNILECFRPALWLDVPDAWMNEFHRTK